MVYETPREKLRKKFGVPYDEPPPGVPPRSIPSGGGGSSGGGGVLLFLNSFIGFTIVAITLCTVFLALGVLMQWHNHRKEGGG